ncbi:MAG: H-type small acid-soluble spore protein [Clostridiales bacterium]|jgi:small acid-soluble spore protein H (minor)|nr:H-type small acid-soluble spore protein [Clostridiales bacterium]
MDPERAKQIAKSPIMANVTFEHKPVYIESVNEAQMTADIHYLDRPQVRKQIPLGRLVEHNVF